MKYLVNALGLVRCLYYAPVCDGHPGVTQLSKSICLVNNHQGDGSCIWVLSEESSVFFSFLSFSFSLFFKKKLLTLRSVLSGLVGPRSLLMGKITYMLRL